MRLTSAGRPPPNPITRSAAGGRSAGRTGTARPALSDAGHPSTPVTAHKPIAITVRTPRLEDDRGDRRQTAGGRREAAASPRAAPARLRAATPGRTSPTLSYPTLPSILPLNSLPPLFMSCLTDLSSKLGLLSLPNTLPSHFRPRLALRRSILHVSSTSVLCSLRAPFVASPRGTLCVTTKRDSTPTGWQRASRQQRRATRYSTGASLWHLRRGAAGSGT